MNRIEIKVYETSEGIKVVYPDGIELDEYDEIVNIAESNIQLHELESGDRLGFYIVEEQKLILNSSLISAESPERWSERLYNESGFVDWVESRR